MVIQNATSDVVVCLADLPGSYLPLCIQASNSVCVSVKSERREAELVSESECLVMSLETMSSSTCLKHDQKKGSLKCIWLL